MLYIDVWNLDYVPVDAWSLFYSTLQVVILPVTLGMLLNRYTPRLVAPEASRNRKCGGYPVKFRRQGLMEKGRLCFNTEPGVDLERKRKASDDACVLDYGAE